MLREVSTNLFFLVCIPSNDDFSESNASLLSVLRRILNLLNRVSLLVPSSSDLLIDDLLNSSRDISRLSGAIQLLDSEEQIRIPVFVPLGALLECTESLLQVATLVELGHGEASLRALLAPEEGRNHLRGEVCLLQSYARHLLQETLETPNYFRLL
ncbi:hypothetical protein [Candidatus Similichlamydia epinepheli]|uniref:hypothetical protein n=1 Tax=Candidatus Similichlamydia epinepheli TaxID=1903953 RepID=UPI000D37BB48|nr:hypothetical protein [Candidatus Similichlamydia epinepheli]